MSRRSSAVMGLITWSFTWYMLGPTPLAPNFSAGYSTGPTFLSFPDFNVASTAATNLSKPSLVTPQNSAPMCCVRNSAPAKSAAPASPRSLRSRVRASACSTKRSRASCSARSRMGSVTCTTSPGNATGGTAACITRIRLLAVGAPPSATLQSSSSAASSAWPPSGWRAAGTSTSTKQLGSPEAAETFTARPTRRAPPCMPS
mmetsp:Transcript_74997/g.229482  ORF Transcript_74997/g.229482 Transcript_74997/m.229482 type:complete len:202 (-) Transcript_74997:288-893(-)